MEGGEGFKDTSKQLLQDNIWHTIWTFQYTIMPYDLKNALALFQYMVNDIFHDFLDTVNIA